jgi:hypothetical protein
VSLLAAPVIPTVGGQVDVAEGKPRLGEIASDEVGVVVGEPGSGESLGAEEKAGATIHQEAGGLMGRDAGGVTMMVTTAQEILMTGDPAMAEHEVVVEHRGATAPEFGEGEHLEFDFETGFGGELFAEAMQGVAEAAFGDEGAAAGEHVEFEVVIGLILAAFGGTEDAAFTAAVAAAEENGLELGR